MRILYAIGGFYPAQAGGPSSSISWLAKHVKRKGVATTVVTTTYGIAKERNIVTDQWLDTEFGKVIYHTYFKIMLPLKMLRSSIKSLKHNDIVHLTSIFYPPCLIIASVAFVWKKTVFWESAGELAGPALQYGRLRKKIFLFFAKYIIKNRPFFHTTSAKESTDVKNVFGANTHIFEAPNFIDDIQRVHVPVKKQLLFIGRIHPIKAIENLIHAVSMSTTFREAGYKLVIAGDYDNNYGRTLQELALSLGLSEQVDFIGHVEDSIKDKLYAESYFMVLPSHSENFANVVVEALAQGTPVIASTGTPWQILKDKKAGFYVANSPQELAASIDNALQLNDLEYATYRSTAYKLMQDDFSMQKGVDQWIDVYTHALASNN